MSRPPAKAPAHARAGGATGCRCCPVLAVLIVLSVITEAPLWLLIFPLMFLRSRRHSGTCAPPHGHADYRRTDRSHGW